MAILATDIKFKYPLLSTGGGMSDNVITSGSPNNLWENVDDTELLNGSSTLHKVFVHVDTNTNDALSSCKVWNDAITVLDDFFAIYPGTATDTESTMSTTNIYGTGELNTGITGGATTTLIIDVESSTMLDIAKAGRMLRISDKSDPEAATGNAEEVEIDTITSATGTQITLELTTAVTNSYAAGAKVQAYLPLGTGQATADTYVVTTAGDGDFDDTNYPVAMINAGAKYETITVEYDTATDFTVTGSVAGEYGTGSRNSDYVITNPVTGKVVGTIPTSAWSGTWALGDTLTFITYGAYLAFWLERNIPSGTSSLDGAVNDTYFTGQK